MRSSRTPASGCRRTSARSASSRSTSCPSTGWARCVATRWRRWRTDVRTTRRGSVDLGLKDQVVFITGGSRGIGRATAELLVEEGCNVAITGRDEDTLRRAVEELGGEEGALGIRGDMTDNADSERAGRETIERFGRIDVLVTCAGSSPGGLLENLTEEEWFGSLNLKFMGYVRSGRAVIPHMLERGGGAIVLVGGNDGLKPSYWEMT